MRVVISAIAALAISTTAGAQTRRLPALPVGFWRLDGTKVAEEAMSKGDSGLIVLVVPDSTVLAFKRPLNLEMNTQRDLRKGPTGHYGYGFLCASPDVTRFSRLSDGTVVIDLRNSDPEIPSGGAVVVVDAEGTPHVRRWIAP